MRAKNQKNGDIFHGQTKVHDNTKITSANDAWRAQTEKLHCLHVSPVVTANDDFRFDGRGCGGLPGVETHRMRWMQNDGGEFYSD